MGVERFLSGQAARRHFAKVKASRDSLELVMAERAATDTARADSIQALEAERLMLDALLDQEKQVARKAEAEVRMVTAELREHLAEDTAGLAQVEELEEWHAAEVDAYEMALANVTRQNELLLRENQLFTHRLEARDSTITALRIQNDLLMEEAQKWYRKANPPFHVKLMRTSLECGAGGLAAYGASGGEPLVGLAGFGGCSGIKIAIGT